MAVSNQWPGVTASSFVAKTYEIWQLEGYIGWLNGGKVLINANGEMLGPDLPAIQDVARYCNEGGVYVDYCGWPMYYDSHKISSRSRFKDFLPLIGADPNYCLGFMGELGTWPNTCNPFIGYPYPRGWLSPVWLDYHREAVIVADYDAPTNLCWPGGGVGSGQPLGYVYSVVGIHASGGGWYFYGFGWLDGDSVPPDVFARFIKSLVGTAGGGGTPGGGTPGGGTPGGGTPGGGTPGGGTTGGGTPGGGGGGITISNPNPPPKKADYVLYAGVAGGAIAVGVGLYLVARGISS